MQPVTKKLRVLQVVLCRKCGTETRIDHDEYENEYRVECPKCGDAGTYCSTAAEAKLLYQKTTS